MAYLQARSGIARSGVTYAGWTPPNVVFYINGVDRTANVLWRDWSLTLRGDQQPATVSFLVHGITPSVGADVKLTWATPNDYLFGGTLLQRSARPVSGDSDIVTWECTAVGYEWLLDRYDLVLAQYASTSVATIVADVLARFTDGGFALGYVPESLGTLTVEFTYASVTECFRRIATAKDAVWRVTPDKRVDLFVTYPETALATVTAAAIVRGSLRHQSDLTQVRTRVLFEGHGSTATMTTPAGATTVAVADTAPFSTDGGVAVSGRNQFTYTGTSIGSGAGTLTGVSGIVYDIQENDTVSILVENSDAGAETALAALLGGGLDGQATHYRQDRRLSESEAVNRASTDLSILGGVLEDVSFEYVTARRHLRAGRSITVNVTAPITISGTFTVQTVQITPQMTVGGTDVFLRQHVSLSGFTRTLTDILRQVRA